MEKRRIIGDELTAQFQKQNQQMPTTLAGYRELIDGMNKESAAYKELLVLAPQYVEWLGMVSGKLKSEMQINAEAQGQTWAEGSGVVWQYVDAASAANDATSGMANSIDDFAKRATDAAQGLWDWLNKQILGETSSLSPAEKLAEAERQAMSAANAGELDKLPALLDTVLQLRREVGGAAGYADYEAGIRGAVAGLIGQPATMTAPAPISPPTSQPVTPNAPATVPAGGITQTGMAAIIQGVIDAINIQTENDNRRTGIIVDGAQNIVRQFTGNRLGAIAIAR